MIFSISILIFLAAVLLDLIFADDLLSRWHPVRAIGNLISYAEKVFYPENEKSRFIAGLLLTLLVLLLVVSALPILLYAAFLISGWLYLAASLLLTYWALACGGLAKEARGVLSALEKEGLESGRQALARIVGRQTDQLQAEDIYRAVIETVAENLSDAVIAPAFYLILGGLPAAWAYKTINTLDSMIGYRSRRYLYFGRFAARLDDLVNLIPARISGLLIVGAAFLQGLDWRRGLSIMIRDHRAHLSPNSAWPEAAMAGILGIRLGGSHHYHGEFIEKPYIGDNLYPVSAQAVKTTITTLYLSSLLFYSLAIIFLLVVN